MPASSRKEKFDGRIADVTIAGERALAAVAAHVDEPQRTKCREPRSSFTKCRSATCWWFATILTCRWASCGFAAKARPAGRRDWKTSSSGWVREEFSRLRIGIGPVPDAWDAADFVLGRFGPSERTMIDEAIDRAAEAVECWVAEGIAVGMNRFN